MQLADSSALILVHTFNLVIKGEGQKLRAQFRPYRHVTMM